MGTLHTPVSGSAVQVYSPPAAGIPHVTLSNEGSSTVWIGAAGVQPNAGVPLAPGQQAIFPLAYQALYAVSSVSATATATTLSAAANAGATSLSVVSGVGIANGQVVQIGSGTNLETATVTAGGGTTTLTVGALDFDHRTGGAVTVMTSAASAVRTESGTS